MLVKAGLAAAALIGASVSLISLDFRELYNEMYPVNGLRRGVLGLCQVAKPAFIRAMRSDREDCYDSMPDSVEKAIGWVRTSSRLAALRQGPTAVDLAERLLANADSSRRFGFGGSRMLTGYLAMPVGVMPAGATRRCADAVTGLAPLDAVADLRLGLPPSAPSGLPPGSPNERMARRIVGGDEATLAALGLGELGLAPQGVRSAPPNELLLPILRLSYAEPADAATTGSITGAAAVLFAPMPAAEFGDGRLGDGRLGDGRREEGVAWPLAPLAAEGCQIPA